VSEEAAQRPPQAHARSGERQCGARLVGGPYLAVTNLPRRFLHVWGLLPGGGGGGGGRQRPGGAAEGAVAEGEAAAEAADASRPTSLHPLQAHAWSGGQQHGGS
jgi:hypothetical protein